MIGFIVITDYCIEIRAESAPLASLIRDVLMTRIDLEAAERAILTCDAHTEKHLYRKILIRFQRVEVLKENAPRQPDALVSRGEIVIRFNRLERPRPSVVAKEYL